MANTVFLIAPWIAALWIAPARADVLLLDLDGMSCITCEGKVQRALGPLDGVTAVHASTPEQAACLEFEGQVDEGAIADAIAGLGYTLEGISRPDSCPDALVSDEYPDPWDLTEGYDAEVISQGDVFDFGDHLVADKFTIFDFGAPWCSPCHVAANRLRSEMDGHDDLAVRAISLGQDPRASFQFPVAKQHLAFAPGLPWFVVYNPRGRAIYKGADVGKALAAIDKKR
jgi:copper chaperone CopZ